MQTLNEEINQIKSMMGLICEIYDPEVAKIQNELKDKYNLGTTGPKGDGVDGVYGPLTNAAYEKEYGKPFESEKEVVGKIADKDSDDESSDSKGESDGGVDVILMGGLDYRPGDLKIGEQVKLLKSKLTGKNIIGHRYNDVNSVIQSIKENPDAYVILFSAGGGYSSQIAKQIKNKNKLFIVEPYAVSKNTASSVQSAVASGVPSSNVVVGPTQGRGSGVIPGSTKTPSGVSHWGALGYVTNLIK
jgi:hypothetical protein